MHFTLPYPVETLRRVRTTEVRTLPIGGSIQELGPELDPTQAGREWLTSDTNIVELNAVIQYRVKNPIDYLFSVADLTDGRVRDVILGKLVESALTVLVASMTVDETLSSGKASLQEASRQQAQQLANAMRLGLQIDSIHIIEVNPPPTVIAAFNDVSSAKADRERLVSEADAYAKDRLPKARAQANRTLQDTEIYRSETVKTARGETQRFLDLAVEVRAAPEISRRRLWLETIESVLSEANVIVYPPPSDGSFTITQIE
jgi:membrane protease subunit HflK